MSLFKNEVLAEIDKMVPAQMGKVKQVMLFTLIDHYIDGKCTDQEFVSGLKSLLGVGDE